MKAPKNPKPTECEECGHTQFDLISNGQYPKNQEYYYWECKNCGDRTSYLNFN